MKTRLLSKTKYMHGLQCPKLLWLIFNDPDKLNPPDATTQRVFDQGHLIGEMAKNLFPAGIDIPDEDFTTNLEQTQELLARRRPLFEAGFLSGNLFSRLDILNPVQKDSWDIIEVKSSTRVKNENIHDVSFQRFCAQKAGIKINKCFLAFINNRYLRKRQLEPSHFFSVQDITVEVNAASKGLEERIQKMLALIDSKECPKVKVGECCNNPYNCPVSLCWEELPKNNVFTLNRGWAASFELFDQGILNIKDIPDSFKLNAFQKVQKECDLSGAPHIEFPYIRQFKKSLLFPIHYLDFGTISPAVPLFEGTRPYQKIPFQFSLDIDSPGREMKQVSFLAEGKKDWRRELLQRLKAEIRDSGSIVSYDRTGSEWIFKGLAAIFPEYAQWTEEIGARMVDLGELFRAFHYYNPTQNGDLSLSGVIKALTGEGYEVNSICDNDTAGGVFLDITFSDDNGKERKKVRAELEKYRSAKSRAMLQIVKKIKEMSRQNS